MLKSNTFKVCLLVPVIIFCLNLKGFSFDQCIPPDCPSDISTIPESVQHTAGWLLEWDPTNPQEIDRNSSVTVKIIGGVPPYSWLVAGTDFWLDDSETQSKENQLNAGPSSCGTATITVTDARNRLVTGHVRSDNGNWVNSGDWFCTCNTGAGGCCYNYWCVVGHLKYVITNHPDCYIDGRSAVCSWLGGCSPSGIGGCPVICGDTQTNPCCGRDSGYLCETCLEIQHDTIYRHKMEIWTWECD